MGFKNAKRNSMPALIGSRLPASFRLQSRDYKVQTAASLPTLTRIPTNLIAVIVPRGGERKRKRGRKKEIV